MSREVYYSIVEQGNETRYLCKLARDYTICRQLEAEDVAEICAEQFHSYHDGWECNWPLTFVLYESWRHDSPAICNVLVQRETEPVFSGSMVKKESGQ